MPSPRQFHQAGFSEPIMRAIHRDGFPHPTPIQAQGWPVALAGSDLIGIAETGSGKTLAFLLPAFIPIAAQTPLQWGEGPIGLVLAPTRELANQIQAEADKFGQAIGGPTKCRNCCVYGGVSKGMQHEDIYLCFDFFFRIFFFSLTKN